MEAPARTATLARAASRAAWPVTALAVAAITYAPLWRAGLFMPSRYRFETALFRPAPMPALFVIAIAGWIAWRRAARLRALATPRSGTLAAAGFALQRIRVGRAHAVLTALVRLGRSDPARVRRPRRAGARDSARSACPHSCCSRSLIARARDLALARLRLAAHLLAFARLLLAARNLRPTSSASLPAARN